MADQSPFVPSVQRTDFCQSRVKGSRPEGGARIRRIGRGSVETPCCLGCSRRTPLDLRIYFARPGRSALERCRDYKQAARQGGAGMLAAPMADACDPDATTPSPQFMRALWLKAPSIEGLPRRWQHETLLLRRPRSLSCLHRQQHTRMGYMAGSKTLLSEDTIIISSGRYIDLQETLIQRGHHVLDRSGRLCWLHNTLPRRVIQIQQPVAAIGRSCQGAYPVLSAGSLGAKLNTQDHGGKLSRELDWYCTHIVFGPEYTGKLESAYIVDPDAEYLSSQDLVISAHGNYVVENEKGGVEKVHVRPGIHPKLVTDDWVARVAGLAMMSVDGTMFA